MNKGMTYVSWQRGQLETEPAERSYQNMVELGVNAVALVPNVYQETHHDQVIDYHARKTTSDEELNKYVLNSKANGLSVMVKPHLGLLNDSGYWRGNIGQEFTDTMWSTWFEAYGKIILHYSELSEASGADLFCIGTELVTASKQEAKWRSLVAGVRQVFHGKLVYAANHGEESSVTWWDALDYIGVDAYYSLGKMPAPNAEQVQQFWHDSGAIDHLANLSRQNNRQILFTEIGYRSVVGANMRPYEWKTNVAVDMQAQADCYQAALEVFPSQPWFEGMYWWNWDADPTKGGPADTDYTPHNKLAEEVLRHYYSAS
jgi:hypothetical protein